MQTQTNASASNTSSLSGKPTIPAPTLPTISVKANPVSPSITSETPLVGVPSSQTGQVQTDITRAHTPQADTTQVNKTQVDASQQTGFSEKDPKVKLNKSKRLVSKKQIPTVLGLLILFVALISGVLLFGQGTGVFAPRATPQTTPKNIRISNVTDKTFTISFHTDESTVAFIKYGEDEKSLKKQASDDRDQLSGVVKDYRLHHITVRNLEPGKEYFYVLGTGSSTFDNEGQAYNITTATKQNQSPPNNQTVYGNVLGPDGSSVEGAIAYVFGEMGTLSSLVKSSGSWGISMANAFSLDKTTYAVLSDESPIEIRIQGLEPDLVSSIETTIAAAQPVADLTLGQDGPTTELTENDSAESIELDKTELLADAEVSIDGSLDSIESSTAGSLQGLLDDEDLTNQDFEVIPPLELDILDLSELNDVDPASATVILTTQPQIKATLPANTVVRITIHSDTKIDGTTRTDADGNLIFDVAKLGKNLEPGEHTASYTYIDPITGEEVTKTVNFTVDPTATPRQLATVTNPTPTPSIPYGSGNPYVPTSSVTPTATTTPLVSTNSTTVSTDSGQYNAGSVGTTIALLLGGVFFILAGAWSYFLANSFEHKE